MIVIDAVTKENFSENSLDDYARTQEVTEVYRRVEGGYRLISQPYVEDWDSEKKRSVARDLLSDDYISYAAFDGKKVVGFIGLIRKPEGERIILDMMHVSAGYRGFGIGRDLFGIAKAEASALGAKELYISACSSKETIAFYRAMGAELTDKPIERIAEDEPFDLQLVCRVD